MSKIQRRRQANIWNKSTRGNRENEPKLLARLVGLECEFFVRHPEGVERDSVADYLELVTALSQELPLAPSQSSPVRHFMANGSCISLEIGSSADLASSLFEAATPECTSPRDVVVYALANERLLESAFAKSRSPLEWALIKSNSDAHGHTLGQHESYDMQIVSGGWRIAWWLGLLSLLPALLLYRVVAVLWMAVVYGLWGLEQQVARLWNRARSSRLPATATHSGRLVPEKPQPHVGRPPRHGGSHRNERDFDTAIGLLNDDEPLPGGSPPAAGPTLGRSENARDTNERHAFHMTARWMRLAAFGLRCLHQPLALWLGFLLNWLALRRQRRILSAFLASRCVIDGAGYVDDDRRFWVSHRAGLVDRMIGFGSYGGTRPMFRCDAILRDLLSGSPWSLSGYFRLFRARQRIEVASGDSGMCQQSQYLRLGMTLLAIDWAEYARPNSAVPQLRSPVLAMREFAKDWMLVRTVPDRRGTGQSAKDIQRVYLRQIKQWLETRADVPSEAWEIIEQWQSTLNQLVMKPSDSGELPMMLVGRLDWLSKLWVLQQLGPETAWQVKKKIDIRYHELSGHGYHRQLADFLQLAPIVRDDEIERARRAPPIDSPACRRGNLIRELAASTSELRVDWRTAQYELDGVEYQARF